MSLLKTFSFKRPITNHTTTADCHNNNNNTMEGETPECIYTAGELAEKQLEPNLNTPTSDTPITPSSSMDDEDKRTSNKKKPRTFHRNVNCLKIDIPDAPAQQEAKILSSEEEFTQHISPLADDSSSSTNKKKKKLSKLLVPKRIRSLFASTIIRFSRRKSSV
jgi:hypothetical protein